jgi:hypothetical protein
MTLRPAVFVLLGVLSGSVSVTLAQPSSADPYGGTITSAPLDLRLGNIRKFVPTEELDTPLDAAIDEVVVRSPRVRSRLPERMPIPRGVGGLGWLLDHPTQFWRLFVPDPNRSVPNRSVDDPQETPGAHRMRIGEPGRAL